MCLQGIEAHTRTEILLQVSARPRSEYQKNLHTPPPQAFEGGKSVLFGIGGSQFRNRTGDILQRQQICHPARMLNILESFQ